MRPPPKPNAGGKKTGSSSGFPRPTAPSTASAGQFEARPPPDNRDTGEELVQALLAAADDLSRSVDAARHEASEGIVRRAAVELPGAVDRLVLQRYYRLVILFVTASVFWGGICAAVGYCFGRRWL